MLGDIFLVLFIFFYFALAIGTIVILTIAWHNDKKVDKKSHLRIVRDE